MSWWSSFAATFVSLLAFSNPYPDPNAVPKDKAYVPQSTQHLPKLSAQDLRDAGSEVIRVDVDYENEQYRIGRTLVEYSGTPALVKRSQRPDKMGSYQGVLFDKSTQLPVAYDSVGTGMEFRLLTRGMTFRFPRRSGWLQFQMLAENPTTGKMEVVIKEDLPLQMALRSQEAEPELEIRLMQSASTAEALLVNFYADGFQSDRKEAFFSGAQRALDAFKAKKFPFLDRMEIRSVFTASNQMLGSAQNLGLPVKVRDSFLGLYFPYWDPFGRWYNIVYPTSERKFRDGIGLIPYDYPIVLIDSDDYWGIGNFNEMTAIPTQNSSFTYLLIHEFGHYFGLNEEYESGGKTELAFAPGIQEPWSQNITFSATSATLKWKGLISASTPVPTPDSAWTGNGPFGAYKGGYAETPPLGKSYKPGHSCVMKSGSQFCPICKKAIEDKILFDLGNQG